MNEKRIINDLKNGNSEAFKVLYDEYYLKVFNYISGKMDNKANTDDLVQLTFMKIYKNIGNFDSKKSTFYKFVLANCNQVLSDYYTKEKRRNDIAETVELDEQFIDDETADYSEIGEDQYNLKSVFDKLTAEQRLAFDLIYIKNLSIKEAAERMGKTESSVKSLAFRARKVLKEEIASQNPELGKRYGFIKGIKIALVTAACFAIIGGFAYAVYRVYKEKVEKRTFTISELKQDVPEEFAVMSREDATRKINEYLEVFGIEDRAEEEDLHLIRDYNLSDVQWRYIGLNCAIIIDYKSGELRAYSCLNENIISETNTCDDVCEKLSLLDGYELYSQNNVDGLNYLEYEKRYDEIYNPYQKVLIICQDQLVYSISIVNYEYIDKEIRISKDEAMHLAKKNKINVVDIELVIEKIVYNNKETDMDNYDIVPDLEKLELIYKNSDVRKGWKILSYDDKSFFIDSYSGELFEFEYSKGEVRSN